MELHAVQVGDVAVADGHDLAVASRAVAISTSGSGSIAASEW